MAYTKNTTNPAPALSSRVPIYIPKGSANDEPNVFISVGGINYLLPKGKTSYVPREVAEIYKRSGYNQERLDEAKEHLNDTAKVPIF